MKKYAPIQHFSIGEHTISKLMLEEPRKQ